ncbi:hypothetical protein RA27_15065 [Ruegeria sp. ANG-R]|uniref:class I SAM-dependent methyltransferase n=1 Tax=Ruegeria sp. ANG-R TaxID=1577903 RepID=UPI0005803DCF|nr:class I SAM-dependent methyltransferase [Ruegeria sp. ANG-R]KIC40151.1 hypothetical protein RA27_15065 [Ruegeria sp. ANG-R]
MYEILQIVIVVLLLVLLAGVALTFRSARWINRRISSLNETVSELAPFVWATASLNQRLEIGRSLPNWNVWSMPPDTLVQILEIIETRKPKLIVEFGSGISTIVIASKLRDVGGKLISYEHDAEYAENVRHGLTERGLAGFVDLRVRGITPTKFLEYDHRWYDVDLDELPKNADLVVVDGPPMPLEKR